MEIKNELSWSFSRDNIFKRCPRAYFYHYYYSWGGWDKKAPSGVQKAYLLKNIIGLDQWTGQIVHEVIKMLFNRYQRYGEWLTLKEAQEKALNLVNFGWRQSIEKKWKERVKDNLNLFEHYYDIPITLERIEQIKEKIKTCLREFLNSELFTFFQKINPSDWLEIPRLAPSFIWENIKIWANFDFGLRTEEQIHIYDFKTGKKESDDPLQFYCYAFYVQETEEIDLSKVFVTPVYLHPTFFATPISFSASDIEQTKGYIKESYNKMLGLLDDKEKNIASLKNFPKTEEIKHCRFCVFQEICV